MTQIVPTINRLYPGLADSSIEFFNDQEEIKVIQNSKVFPFDEASFSVIQILEEEIEKDPLVKSHLMVMHPDSKIKRTKQFVHCRFSGLDYQGDIKEGKLQEGEYWACPKRGNCPSEGILCKLPSYNDKELTDQDVKLLQLTATNKTNDVIADELSLPLGSFHKAKKYLYEKLGIQTKQEGVMISIFLNLIQF
jgi:DNA-binding CsgD family transcriptional regulator